jgi:hypothetical protein
VAPLPVHQEHHPQGIRRTVSGETLQAVTCSYNLQTTCAIGVGWHAVMWAGMQLYCVFAYNAISTL